MTANLPFVISDYTNWRSFEATGKGNSPVLAGRRCETLRATTGRLSSHLWSSLPDLAAHNFQLRKDSRLRHEQPTFEDTPFDRIGLVGNPDW